MAFGCAKEDAILETDASSYPTPPSWSNTRREYFNQLLHILGGSMAMGKLTDLR